MRFPFLSKPSFRRAAHPDDAEWSLFRWMMAVYLLCLSLTLVIIIGLSVWGVLHDLNQVRETVLETQMERLRSHAVGPVGSIQEELRRNMNSELTGLQVNRRLRRFWNDVVLKDEAWLYGAVVDLSGKVLIHTNRSCEGKELGQVWYERVVSEGGDDVVLTHATALTGGEKALDVRVPIYFDGALVGTFHNGLSYDWLERELAEKRAAAVRYWTWILVIIAAAVIIAGFSLLQISRRLAWLRGGIQLARARRFAEISQLMAGIVHEIRNPLNAMRLNLHVLGCRAAHDRVDVSEPAAEPVGDFAQIIQETNQEIERVEELMRVLLRYARPDQPQTENLEVRQEIQAALRFLKPIFERAEVTVRAKFSDAGAFIHFDRDRFRQILINLINNAKEATGPGGQILMEVSRQDGMVEIIVADDGPGIPAADRERIFEPFFSTKETGTGLGLALVRRYVEEVNGNVTCEPNEPHGARFRLRFTDVTGITPAKVGSY